MAEGPIEEKLTEPERRLRGLRVRVVTARHRATRETVAGRRCPRPPTPSRFARATTACTTPRLKNEEDRDHEDAVEDLPQLEARRQPLVQDGEDGRADHRAEQRAETAERHHHEDAHVHAVEAVRRRADEARAVGEQGARRGRSSPSRRSPRRSGSARRSRPRARPPPRRRGARETPTRRARAGARGRRSGSATRRPAKR